MDYKGLESKIIQSIETFSVLGKVKEILDRGFVLCHINNNLSSGILLTGINPSFNPKHGVWPGKLDPQDVINGKGRFWTKKIKQFGDVWAQISYLDLFPVRESKQEEGFEKTFKSAYALRGALLEITQEEVERLAPKLIVHANRGSMYYWGIKKNTPAGDDANDYEHPWMGYKVKRVVKDISKFNSKEHLVEIKKLPDCMTEERLKKFPLYMIVGYIDNSERINYKRKSTSLEGCFLMEYVMEYRDKKDLDKIYKATEWAEIWKWIKEQSPAD